MKNQLLEIAKIMPSRLVASAPAVIVAAFGEDDPDDIFSSEREDCAAAVQNMLLAITAMGYASCWIDGELKLEGRAEKISSLLHLPAGKRGACAPSGRKGRIKPQKNGLN